MRAGLSGLSNNYLSGIGAASLSAQNQNIANKLQSDQFNIQMSKSTTDANNQALNQASLINSQNQIKDRDTRQDYLAAAAEGLGDVGSEEGFKQIMPTVFGYDSKGKYATDLMSTKACGGKLRKIRKVKK